uniref:ARF like GTPase 14 effector protein n=1 Tax=Leptobrachium leishanense TaxID=445787 RepID=A0A8C5QBT1_9ANUR
MAAARDPDSTASAMPSKKYQGKGKAAKALKSLQFANPGKQTEVPETNKRETRRQQSKGGTDRQTLPSRNRIYDGNGKLISNGMDLCDCLDEDCLGCFYACRKCGSNKCGIECRCDRKWLYEQIQVEGGVVIRNKHLS